MWSQQTRQLIELACQEDLGAAGDLTSSLLGMGKAHVSAQVVVRQGGVICGLTLAPAICGVFEKHLGQPLVFGVRPAAQGGVVDGASVVGGQSVAEIRGPHSAVLAVERTLLNFLGRMSGVATLTRQFVEAAQAANPGVRILDTRKTIPGWRELDKYAVGVGGGRNHRMGLYDAILLKDNHLAEIPLARLAEELETMLAVDWREARAESDAGAEDELGKGPSFVEVEVDNLEQFAEVCKVREVDIVLLDNFTPEQLRAAVQYRDAEGLRGKLRLECSGKVSLETVRELAATGVDRISVGALTHSAPSLDIGLDF